MIKLSAAQVNFGHPLTSNLIWLALPGHDNTVELINQGKLTLLTNGAFSDTNYGSSLKSNSNTNGGGYFPWIRALENLTNEVTIIVFANLTSVATWGHLIDIPYNSNWSSPYSSLRLGEFNGTGKLVMSFSSGGVLFNASSGSAAISSSDGYTMYAAKRSGNNVDFYKNGQYVDSAAPGSSGNIDLGNKREVTLLNRNSGDMGEGNSGHIALAAIFNRSLTGDELMQIYANPYILIKSPAPLYKASTSTNVTVSLGVQSITASQPTLTVDAVRNVSISPSTQIITASQIDPTVSAIRNVTISPSVQVLTANQIDPTVITQRDVSILLGVQDITASQPQPDISAIRNVIVSLAEQLITANQPSLTVLPIRNVTITPDVIDIIANILSPAVSSSQNVIVTPDVLNLTANQLPPTVDTIRNVIVSLTALQLTANTPDLLVAAIRNTLINLGVQNLTANPLSPSVIAITALYNYINLLAKVQQTISLSADIATTIPVSVHIKDVTTISKEGDVTIKYKSAAMS